ncbi:hypothetical protein B0H66DRAFT_594342 [Apodospora peruviana]|uniref:Fun14 family protein n=1 Tax=Apodospora peruviana TaxID=516989 RepID=A0AAE0HV34_9PEZI|nr:hypothetical protein B0H66DRAFT_594342 [Apodospora peruviana]
MATIPLYRAALRRSAVPLSLSAGLGLAMASRQQPMRFDAVYSAPAPAAGRQYSQEPKRKDMLDPEVVKQLSGGSLSGFVAGLLVSVFSKSLVLLIGTSIVLSQVAKRYGIDIVRTLRVRKYLESSRILAALQNKTAFKLSFGLTFALSAFMSF